MAKRGRVAVEVVSTAFLTLGRAQAELGNIGSDTLLPISPTPGDVGVIVAGGAGTHTVYIPSFGPTRAVTREVIFAG